MCIVTVLLLFLAINGIIVLVLLVLALSVPSASEWISAAAQAEFERIQRGAAMAMNLGLEVHAGHGLDFITAERIAELPEIAELNIGHFLIGEAIYSGLDAAVRTMRASMDRGRARIGGRA